INKYRRKCSREFTINENEVLVLVRSAHSVEIGRRTNDGNAMTISKRRKHEPSCRCYRTFFGSAGASRQRLADRRNLVLIYVRRVRQRHTPPIPRFRLRIEPNTRGGDLGKHCGGDHKAEEQSGAEGAHIDLYEMKIPPSLLRLQRVAYGRHPCGRRAAWKYIKSATADRQFGTSIHNLNSDYRYRKSLNK